MALPAGQHHVPIQEERHHALGADVVVPAALPAGQHHVPILAMNLLTEWYV